MRQRQTVHRLQTFAELREWKGVFVWVCVCGWVWVGEKMFSQKVTTEENESKEIRQQRDTIKTG